MPRRCSSLRWTTRRSSNAITNKRGKLRMNSTRNWNYSRPSISWRRSSIRSEPASNDRVNKWRWSYQAIRSYFTFRTFLFVLVALQFEEIDNVKTSLHLNNSTTFSSSVTPDPMAAPAEELIFFDPSEANVPSFQAHFPVSSPTMSSAWPSTATMKKSDSNRGKNDFCSSRTDWLSPAVHIVHQKVLHG